MEAPVRIDVEVLIRTVGYAGLFAVIFAESGLFFGFFLPGDSLLLTARLLAAHGDLVIGWLLLLMPPAAILGDQVGHWFGVKAGPAIFSRDNSLLFRRKNLLAAKAFYEKRGGKTIMLARFMPFIRTFAPIVAGAAEMRYSRFITFIDRCFPLIVAIVILVSATPAHSPSLQGIPWRGGGPGTRATRTLEPGTIEMHRPVPA